MKKVSVGDLKAQFSTSLDEVLAGKKIAIQYGRKKEIVAWLVRAHPSPANGLELSTAQGHYAQIWGVAFSPDGQRIATGSEDKTAKVWDAASGQELLALKERLGVNRDEWTSWRACRHK